MEYLDNDTYYDYVEPTEELRSEEDVDCIDDDVLIREDDDEDADDDNVLLFLRNELKCIEINRKYTKIHCGDDIHVVIPIAEFKTSNKFVLKTKNGDIIKVSSDDLYFD